MKDSFYFIFKRATPSVELMIVGACIDRVDIPAPITLPADLVVDELITDAFGAYTVKLTRGIHLDDSNDGEPLQCKVRDIV